jgi:hypothetical protein
MRRLLVSLGLAVIVGGTVLGAAASLGLTDSSLGAGSAVVASCDDSITVSWPGRGGEPGLSRWNNANGWFEAFGVAFTDINIECRGRPFEVVLTGPGGPWYPVITEYNDGTDPNTDYIYAYFSDQVNAEYVTGVHLLIR